MVLTFYRQVCFHWGKPLSLLLVGFPTPVWIVDWGGLSSLKGWSISFWCTHTSQVSLLMPWVAYLSLPCCPSWGWITTLVPLILFKLLVRIYCLDSFWLYLGVLGDGGMDNWGHLSEHPFPLECWSLASCRSGILFNSFMSLISGMLCRFSNYFQQND